ncbi:hypothetical protein [Paraprevotella clara]
MIIMKRNTFCVKRSIPLFVKNYNPQIQFSAKSETKRLKKELQSKTKRSKKDKRTATKMQPKLAAFLV